MNNIKNKQLEEKLKELKNFPNSKDNFYEEEIFNWVAECVSLFTEIGINTEIIGSFMKNFEYEETKTGSLPQFKKMSIGPFIREEFEYATLGHPYEFKDIKKTHYIKIAFTAARTILERGIEERRIVPISLIEELKQRQKYKQLANTLELLEGAYQKRDEQKMLNEANNLLDEILSLHSGLNKGNISAKLKKIRTDPKIKNQFGNPSDEILNALDNNRIIRNKKSGHIKTPLKYSISLLVALSYAYLVIMFLEIVISSSRLIK